jgi:hypothetical protein
MNPKLIYQKFQFGLSSIFILSIFLNLNCKKNKFKEVNDMEWRNEYSEIVYKTCTKLTECYGDSSKSLKPKLKNFVEGEIKPEKCIEKTKKSNVYLLKVSNPEEAKLASRECFEHLEKMSCEDIKKDKLSEISACKIVRLLQSNR